MNLVWIIGTLFIGGALAGIAERFSIGLGKWVSLLSLAVASIICAPLFSAQPIQELVTHQEGWLVIWQLDWIPRFGIQLLFATDGISLILIALTLFLGFIALFAAWGDINKRVGFFYFNLLWTLAGVVGIFTALDLFLFFFFWEIMLIPMFLIIAIWGHEDRRFAAIKFFIYTQVSSLLMLVAMLALVYIHWAQTGDMTFSWFELLNTHTDSTAGMLIMLGFFIAFLVKLPAFPIHNWLPDAHTQAPTAGSVILAGILLKTGAYGLLRFIIPLFPEASLAFTPWALSIGVISILYGAKMAFAQDDLKRLIAYTSISHMGFVILGIFSWNAWSLQGTLLQMVAHGLSSAGLFALAGTLQHRLHTRSLAEMGGLWSSLPRMAAIGTFFAIAALGLPGLGNFVGEFLVLLGTFQAHPLVASISAVAMILAPVYALIILQKAFYGPKNKTNNESNTTDKNNGPTAVADFNYRELLMMGLLMVALVVMGFFPQLITQVTNVSLDTLFQLGWSNL